MTRKQQQQDNNVGIVVGNMPRRHVSARRHVSLSQNDVSAVCCMRSSVTGVLQKHIQVFREELGTLKRFAAKIHVDEGKRPKFFKARSVPYTMRKKVV